MPGRNHPLPAHRQTLAGAMPAAPAIEDVEQETYAPRAVVVRHDGPVMTHRLPARRAASMTVVVGVPPVQGAVLGIEMKRSRVVICSSDNPFYYSSNTAALSSSGAANTAAATWPAKVPLVLESADAVYLACAVAASTSTIGLVVETYAD